MGEYSTDEVDRGHRAYEAYSAQAGGVSLVTGAGLPTWDALPTTIKAGWVAAGIAAVAEVPDEQSEDEDVDEPSDVALALAEMTVTDLKALAVGRGLAQGGTKAELIARLRESDLAARGA